MDLKQTVQMIMTLINLPLKLLYGIDQSFGLFDWTGIGHGD